MLGTSLPSDAERMDRHYRYQRFIYDNTRTHYLIGRRHLINALAVSGHQTVLEIGCGTAWNLARAARIYPTARLYGVDVSTAMLNTARASLARQGLGKRVHLAHGDATSFQPETVLGQKTFDRIFFSYALSMIPRWQEAVEHGAQCLAPGGQMLIVDFGQCGAWPAAFKSTFFAFLRHYTVTPRADMETVLANVCSKHGLNLKFERLHRGYTDFAVLTRH